jgi:hypothetical protein
MTAWLALCVSALSFSLSAYSLWLMREKERVHAWAEVDKTTTPRLYILTIKLRNPTHYTLKFAGLSVPVEQAPVNAAQDFLLARLNAFRGRSEEWAKENLDKVERGATLHIAGEIPPGETSKVRALLIRGNLSAATKTKVTVYYWSMQNTARYNNQIVTATLPSLGYNTSITTV